jgi:hypothetical protein
VEGTYIVTAAPTNRAALFRSGKNVLFRKVLPVFIFICNYFLFIFNLVKSGGRRDF